MGVRVKKKKKGKKQQKKKKKKNKNKKRGNQKKMEKNMNFGFMMSRHINSQTSSSYWLHPCECIRKLYPNCWIVVIDDNSTIIPKAILISNEKEQQQPDHKIIFIKSEFPGRGELLPYYYYMEYKLYHLFQKAIIIHDGVFIKNTIDFSACRSNVIWDFDHTFDEPEKELELMRRAGCIGIDTPDFTYFHANKSMWLGAFGSMCIIDHDVLAEMQERFNFFGLLNVVKSRAERMHLERIIGVILSYVLLGRDKKPEKSLLGKIHQYCKWGLTFSQYMESPEKTKGLSVVKVWSDR